MKIKAEVMKTKYNMRIMGTVLWCLLTMLSLQAQQTGVNTHTPDASAAFEVSSSTRVGGLLLPRVQLLNNVDVTTIPSPAAGVLVYNLGNSGSGNARVEANRVYFWNGTQWVDIADRQLVRRLLLPPVFFAQCEGVTSAVDILGTNLTNLNNGNGFVVPFPTSSVLVNNYDNITLNSNNTFQINIAGSYEISAFINYSPRLNNGYNSANTPTEYQNARGSLEFRVQRSTNGGTSWTTVGTSRETWSLLTGNYFRNVTMPAMIIPNLQPNDLLRLVIARPNNWGGAHGSSGSTPSINVGEGTVVTRNIRILKVE